MVRDIELNTRAKAALAKQKSLTFLKDGYVFENPVTDERYSEERPLRREYWNPTLKALGMRERHCYQTRHTYATLNLIADANPMWVAKQLGHATMAMLLTIYSRWIDGVDRSSEKGKIDAMFEQKEHMADAQKEKRNYLICLVGARGFEPPTTWPPAKYATRLRYAPKE